MAQKTRRVFAVVVLVLAWVLLATLQSRLLVTAIVALALLPRRFGLAVAALALVGVIVLFPRRTPRPEARVQSIFLDADGARVPMPWLPYLANLVPESDLVRLATLGKAVFPFPTRGALLAELRELPAWDNAFVREYARLRADGFDAAVPSVLPLQLLQQLGLYRGLHHVVLVRPLAPSTTPAPVVVFLHGYMGNFQIYTSYFAALTDQAILLPSTRDLFGLWSNADLTQILGRELDALAASTPIDRQRVHLVGLSNGGSGVNRALASRPTAFRSFTFLSTGINVGDISPSVHAPLGVIYGDRDSFAPNNVAAVPVLRARGLSVEIHAFPRERHFVMLTRRDEVLAAIAHLVAQ